MYFSLLMVKYSEDKIIISSSIFFFSFNSLSVKTNFIITVERNEKYKNKDSFLKK